MKTLLVPSNPGETLGSIPSHLAPPATPLHLSTKAALERLTRELIAARLTTSVRPMPPPTFKAAMQAPAGRGTNAAAALLPAPVFVPMVQATAANACDFSELTLSGHIVEMQAQTIDASIVRLP